MSPDLGFQTSKFLRIRVRGKGHGALHMNQLSGFDTTANRECGHQRKSSRRGFCETPRGRFSPLIDSEILARARVGCIASASSADRFASVSSRFRTNFRGTCSERLRQQFPRMTGGSSRSHFTGYRPRVEHELSLLETTNLKVATMTLGHLNSVLYAPPNRDGGPINPCLHHSVRSQFVPPDRNEQA